MCALTCIRTLGCCVRVVQAQVREPVVPEAAFKAKERELLSAQVGAIKNGGLSLGCQHR